MPRFSKRSKRRLSECHPLLQRLFNDVVKTFDCSIVKGYRDQLSQQTAYLMGVSKVIWPNSKHNSKPSLAVDVYPYINGISYDTNLNYYFSGYVLGISKMLGIHIRSGGDWDMDNDIHDQKFNDIGHYELIL